MQEYNTFNAQPKIKTDYRNTKMPYTLLNDVRYQSSIIDGKSVKVYINKGFKWNGADIVPILWGAILGSRFNPDYLPASMVHDYCCNNKPKFTNKEASVMFRDILVMYGVNKIKADTMMYAVWFFQGLWFNKGWKK